MEALIDNNHTAVKIVNFLDFSQKTRDQRFLFHQNAPLPTDTKTIYWIGTIDLASVDLTAPNVKISFYSSQGVMLLDAFRTRKPDGADGDLSLSCEFSLSHAEFRQALLGEKAKSRKFFHLRIEEVFFADGTHVVCVLGRPEKEIKFRYGFGAHKSFVDLDTRITADFSHVSISSEDARLKIASHEKYEWMK